MCIYNYMYEVTSKVVFDVGRCLLCHASLSPVAGSIACGHRAGTPFVKLEHLFFEKFRYSSSTQAHQMG
jgi:hypothetical protein